MTQLFLRSSPAVMLRNKVYYAAKPFIPGPVRMALRRSLARRQRRRHAATWPIDPGAAGRPETWTGWPDGKRFAVVLTHDVEGSRGLGRVRRLAELERELGYRSSYNFVPEGSYDVPEELRAWLDAAGMEVGVHDLHHDGKLLASKPAFSSQAVRINQHLRAWGAVGFRAGFMLHNLDWFRELDIRYDLSTFDTDPFEPQPEPVRTLFPFRVPRNSDTSSFGRSTSYIELPYTLPQDSTLFIVLRETTPEIWLQKSDWIAEHGGMILVNVHPDYTRLDGEANSRGTYPVGHYSALLQHLAQRYSGQFWQPLPREIAAWMS